MAKADAVPVRFDSEEEKARFAECAKKDGVSMAVWIRNACRAYADGPVEVQPVEALKSKPTKKEKPESEMTFQELRNRRVGIKEPVSALDAFKHMLPPD